MLRVNKLVSAPASSRMARAIYRETSALSMQKSVSIGYDSHIYTALAGALEPLKLSHTLIQSHFIRDVCGRVCVCVHVLPCFIFTCGSGRLLETFTEISPGGLQ